MRKLIGFAEFSETVQPDGFEQVTNCFFEAFSTTMIALNTISENLSITYKRVTKWSLVQDVVIAKLKEAFSNNEEVEVNKWNGIHAIKFGEKAFCRIKKFVGQTANVSVTLTKQQKRFNSQYHIEGIPNDPTLITIGYHVNKAETHMIGVFAACSDADGLIWFNKIGGEGFVQLSLFNEPIAPVVTLNPILGNLKADKPRRVKPKRDPKKDTGTSPE